MHKKVVGFAKEGEALPPLRPNAVDFKEGCNLVVAILTENTSKSLEKSF